MNLKITRWILSYLLLAFSYPVLAQQPTKLFRIGYLSSAEPATESARAEGISLALRERGYVEGQNLAIVYRYTKQIEDRRDSLAGELAALKLDIILVLGGPGLIRAVKNATQTIPIVMAGSPADPVRAGLVNSLARPGGNITGIYLLSRELGGKRLELLKEAVGKLTRVAILYEPNATGTAREIKEDIPIAAKALKLAVQPLEARNVEDLEKVLAVLNKQRPDGLYVTNDGVFRINQKRIVDFALNNRLPLTSGDRENVDAGGLMYYGADQTDRWRRVAYYVDRILKGTKPADLPVEQPTKFEFVVNLKTAKQIGVNLAPEVMARATKLIR